MLLIRCPVCAMERPELEFHFAGQANLIRPADPQAADDAEWGAFLYLRDNRRGVQAERWRHLHGCGRFFNAIRDTVSDRLLATHPTGTSPPDGLDPA